jgi:hypothetical protein
MIALRQRLFRVRAIQVAELGKARLSGAEFNQFACRAVILLRKTLTNAAGDRTFVLLPYRCRCRAL